MNWSVEWLVCDPSEVFQICRRCAGFEFSTAYAESAMIFGGWLVVDRLFAPVLSLSGNCIRASRTSPQWLTIEDYFVIVRPRPAWASL